MVDVSSTDPDTFSVTLTDRVLKSVRGRQESRRHAGVKAEDDEGGKVAKGHRSARHGVARKVWCGVVVPGQEGDSAWDVHQRVDLVEEGHEALVVLEDVRLQRLLAKGEEDAEH